MNTIESKQNLVAIAAYVSAAKTALILAGNPPEKKRANQPKDHRTALHSSLCSSHATAWRQILSCDSFSDFLSSMNIDKHVFFEVVLSQFSIKRKKSKLGSPYLKGPKQAGRPCMSQTFELLGLIFCRINSSVRQQNLCPVFRLVSTSINYWFHYSLMVLFQALRRIDDAKKNGLRRKKCKNLQTCSQPTEKMVLVERFVCC